MRTEGSIDLLRMTLARHGFIRMDSYKNHIWSECRLLSSGEWLVSLLGHDRQLLDLLDDALLYDEQYSRFIVDGDRETGFLLGGSLGVDLDLWVETIRFTWLGKGVSEALDFIRCTGFLDWSKMRHGLRSRYLDDLVLSTQRALRASGLKHRTYAEFFADPMAVQQLRTGAGS